MPKLRFGAAALLSILIAITANTVFAAELRDELIGKWATRTPRGLEVFQFFPGGTATSTQANGGAVDTWSWQMLDEAHLRLDNESSPVRHPMVVDAQVDGSVLTLGQNGKIIGRYNRLP